jgi:hypothetical protein
MLVMGFSVGAVAFGITELLSFMPPQIVEVEGLTPDRLFSTAGKPYMTAYLVYFGILFVVLRWWRQADPLRPRRFGFWNTAVVVLSAILLQALCPIPQGFLIALNCALAVQLAAPWVTTEHRRARQDELKPLT